MCQRFDAVIVGVMEELRVRSDFVNVLPHRFSIHSVQVFIPEAPSGLLVSVIDQRVPVEPESCHGEMDQQW